MNPNLLPENFKFANQNQQAFINKASIMEICQKYRTYERVRNQINMKSMISTTKKILDKLVDDGYVSKITNPNSDWNVYCPTDKSEPTYEAKQNMNTYSNVSEFNDILDDKGQIKFDIKESKLSGIDLVCAIADKYRNIAFSARSRGIKFDLTLDDIEGIILADRCYYSNVLFDGERNIKTIDRVDSTKGYVSGNIVPCTSKINSLKNNLLEHKDTRLFESVHDLKRFVDILYVTQTKSENPLVDLLNSDRLNTEKKG